MSRRLQLRQLLLLCFLLTAQISSAEVSENLDYSYYTANADPARSLLNILNASSPIRQNGQIYHGYTNWYVNWNFRWYEEPDGRCRITSTSTKLTGDIKLPRLNGATSAQQGQFAKFVSALRTHEHGHYGIGKAAATEIDRKILSLPEMTSCSALESTANNLGMQIIDKYKERELRYDDSTGHGKSQGAWLER